MLKFLYKLLAPVHYGYVYRSFSAGIEFRVRDHEGGTYPIEECNADLYESLEIRFVVYNGKAIVI